MNGVLGGLVWFGCLLMSFAVSVCVCVCVFLCVCKKMERRCISPSDNKCHFGMIFV